LWGENPSTIELKQKKYEGSKDATPTQEKHQDREEKTRSPKIEIKTPEPPKMQTPVTTPGKPTKKIEDHIASITPLQ
jgi:hypothetical protein